MTAKFDMQLGQAMRDEARLHAIFSGAKVELKSESYLWERTGNICIEYRQRGKPSGIAITEADFWVHELKAADGATKVYLIFPIGRLKELARDCYARGLHRRGGDGGEFEMVLIPLGEILK